jgi:hypothetical protein
MMQAGRDALSWGLQRLGIGLAILVGLVLFAYVMVVAVVVFGEAIAGFG